MSKKRIIAIAVCFAGFCSVFAITNTIMLQNAESIDVSGSIMQADKLSDAGGGKFLITIADGRIVVFSESFGDIPLIETEILASSLRDADREELENGMTFSSYDEVLRLLEDFGV